jgi:hypothetical protein
MSVNATDRPARPVIKLIAGHLSPQSIERFAVALGRLLAAEALSQPAANDNAYPDEPSH